MRHNGVLLSCATFALLAASQAQADIRVGVILSLSGTGASIGNAQKNALAFLPTTIGGEQVTYLVEDDASDKNRALNIARRLFGRNVDVIIGPSLSSSSMTVLEELAARCIPMVSLASSDTIIHPLDANRRWAFKIAPSDAMMANTIASHMARQGVRTVAFAGVNDAYGQSWLAAFGDAAAKQGLKVVGKVLWDKGQSLQASEARLLVDTAPDAVLLAAWGAAGAPPQKLLRALDARRPIYQTHGVVNTEFLGAAGKDADGLLAPVGSMMVADQLPDTSPNKAVALAFVREYEEKYGVLSRSPFAGHMYDAGLVLAAAAPRALRVAKPGTPAFRLALREALETTRGVVGTHGVLNFSRSDHIGLDGRDDVMVKAVGAFWAYLRK